MGGRGSSSGTPKGSRGGGITGGWNGDQYWGENSKGFGASILDGGKSNINLYRYGSKQIYEVKFHFKDGSQAGTTKYVSSKAEATKMAKKWLKDSEKVN